MSLEFSAQSIDIKPAETLYALRTACLNEFANRYGGKIINVSKNPFWLADQYHKLDGNKIYQNLKSEISGEIPEELRPMVVYLTTISGKGEITEIDLRKAIDWLDDFFEKNPDKRPS